MENLKNVAPVEDFNWDAYENGEAVTSASHEELEKAYDGTLNLSLIHIYSFVGQENISTFAPDLYII